MKVKKQNQKERVFRLAPHERASHKEIWLEQDVLSKIKVDISAGPKCGKE
jgi:predicted small metal-binding protein